MKVIYDWICKNICCRIRKNKKNDNVATTNMIDPLLHLTPTYEIHPNYSTC